MVNLKFRVHNHFTIKYGLIIFNSLHFNWFLCILAINGASTIVQCKHINVLFFLNSILNCIKICDITRRVNIEILKGFL